jgi:hypothetical protein
MIYIDGEIFFEASPFFSMQSVALTSNSGVALLVEQYCALDDPDVYFLCCMSSVAPDYMLFACVRRSRSSIIRFGETKEVEDRAIESAEATVKQRSQVPITVQSPEYAESKNPEQVLEAIALIRDFLQYVMGKRWRKGMNALRLKYRSLKRVFLLLRGRKFWRCAPYIRRILTALNACRKRLDAAERDGSACEFPVRAKDLNPPKYVVAVCVVRSLYRFEHRWLCDYRKVFDELSNAIVPAADHHSTLFAALLDEFENPGRPQSYRPKEMTARKGVKVVARGAQGYASDSDEHVGSGTDVNPNINPSVSGLHRRGVVLECSPHSPIPSLVGTRRQLRAMLLSTNLIL